MSDIWDAADPAAQPFFRFRQNWLPLAGFGFGLRETALIGQARLSLPDAFDLAALDAGMERYIKEKPPEDARGDSPAEKLVRRALFWVGALQRQAQVPVFGEAYVGAPRKSERGGDAFRIATPSLAPPATILALQWVGAAINNFLATGRLRRGAVDDARREFAEINKTLQKYRLQGVNPFRILAAAHELDIPTQRLQRDIFAFGMGARTRWMQSSITDRTSLIGARLASDKYYTAEVLRRAGLPAPIHALVNSAEEAVKTARQIGYPVVVKPTDRQQGRGVAANLTSDQAVAAAYGAAARISKRILVEKFFEGTDYRMSVLEGKIFRVSARLPGGVTGDGKSTIAQLVEMQQQSDLQQKKLAERGHHLIDLDGEAMQLLAEARLAPETVLAPGRYQRLRRRGNVSAGGTPLPIDPKEAHPDNIRLAERAVSALRLDLGGVDVILPDISRSWLETGGLICEVNPQPQLGPRNMPGLLSRMMEGGDGRIPVLIVIGAGEGLDWSRLGGVASQVGYATTEGMWLGANRISGKQRSAFAAAQGLAANPQAEALIAVISPAEILALGLPVDRCDLVIDAPDNWPSVQRETISGILEIVLPQSRKAVYLQPAHALLGSHRAAGRLEAAGADSLQRICEEFLAARQDRAASAPPEPSRAAAG